MKRVLKWVGVVVAVLVLLAGSFFYYVFGSNKTVVDGEIVPGVTTVKDGIANLFILDAGGGKVALVDAGNDKSGKAILAALAEMNVAPDAVAGIFLTHGHPDHTAACHLFKSAEIYAMPEDIPLVGDAAKVTHPLKDGEVVTVGTLPVEAFATPGHTPGSAVYLAHGVLFFGDSAGGSKSEELMPAVRLISKNPDQNVASLKALAARLAPRKDEIKALAFGHTGWLPGFAPLAAFAEHKP